MLKHPADNFQSRTVFARTARLCLLGGFSSQAGDRQAKRDTNPWAWYDLLQQLATGARVGGLDASKDKTGSAEFGMEQIEAGD
jgi:hypothetical protein